MAPGPADPINVWADWERNVNWNTNLMLRGLAGPGTIDPGTEITFNKVGPLYYNTQTNGGYFMDQATSYQYRHLWGSFDDSTNAPVVYPNGTSLASLESQIMMQVTSIALPPARVGVAYSTQLTGTGGSGAPYNWSLAPNSLTPPSWLGGATAVPSSGGLSGTPHASDIGASSFFVKMADRLNSTRFTVWQVTLTVLP
jgi:hypothetical protein